MKIYMNFLYISYGLAWRFFYKYIYVAVKRVESEKAFCFRVTAALVIAKMSHRNPLRAHNPEAAQTSRCESF